MRHALLLTGGLLTAAPAVVPGLAGQDLSQLFKELSGITIYAFTGRLAGPGFELLVELDSTRTWTYELGLGYEHLTGFAARAGTGLDLRGSLRTVPRLSLYAAPRVTLARSRPYIALNTGLVQLRTVRAYDTTGVQYGLEGDTFEFGFGVGLIHETGFFLEATYRDHSFQSVDYKFPPGTSAVPAGWPRALELSTFQVSIGYQSGKLRRPPGSD